MNVEKRSNWKSQGLLREAPSNIACTSGWGVSMVGVLNSASISLSSSGSECSMPSTDSSFASAPDTDRLSGVWAPYSEDVSAEESKSGECEREASELVLYASLYRASLLFLCSRCWWINSFWRCRSIMRCFLTDTEARLRDLSSSSMLTTIC